MRQKNPKKQENVKNVLEKGDETIPGAVLTGVQSFLDGPVYYMEIVPLEKPIPIPKSRKKKRK